MQKGCGCGWEGTQGQSRSTWVGETVVREYYIQNLLSTKEKERYIYVNIQILIFLDSKIIYRKAGDYRMISIQNT